MAEGYFTSHIITTVNTCWFEGYFTTQRFRENAEFGSEKFTAVSLFSIRSSQPRSRKDARSTSPN